MRKDGHFDGRFGWGPGGRPHRRAIQTDRTNGVLSRSRHRLSYIRIATTVRMPFSTLTHLPFFMPVAV